MRQRADWAEGAIALAEGRLDSATALFLRANAGAVGGTTHNYTLGLVEAAGVLDQRGRRDSAIVLYERALQVPLIDGAGYEISWYPFVLRRLGQLHESLGHRDEAIDYYRQFIDLWKDADPELQPQVEAARAAFASLMG